MIFVCSLPQSAPHFSPCTPVLPVPMEPVGLAAQHPTFWHPRPPLQVDLRWLLMRATLSTCVQLLPTALIHWVANLSGRKTAQHIRAASKLGTAGHCNLSDVSSHQSGEPNCLKYLKTGTLKVWVTPRSSLPPLVASPRGGPITHVWFKKDASTKQSEGRQEGL